MITRKEFEDYIYSDDVDFDIDTWGDIKFVACQEFLVEYINKQLTQKDATISDLNIINVNQDKKLNRQAAIISVLKEAVVAIDKLPVCEVSRIARITSKALEKVRGIKDD